MSDPVNDLEQELLAAAERQHRSIAVGAGRQRLRGHRGPKRLGLTAATLSIAAAVALLFTAPWNDAPAFLERAHAALSPRAGTILHMKWEGSGLTDPACTAPNEIWIDQTPPHRFRALLTYPAGPGRCRFEGVTPNEVGGDLDSGQELWFVPPDTLAVWPLGTGGHPSDPVTELREAISAGRAHHEGQTQLEGRTVERIRIDPAPNCLDDPNCPREPGYAYVDPKTFHLVRVEGPHEIARAGAGFLRYSVERYVTFEYLPRTNANVALADIQAQHPHITP